MDILAAAIVCFVSILFLSPLAKRFQLLDLPDSRKQHRGSVPLIGGIAVFLATMVACIIAFGNDPRINMYLISAALIVTLGVIDDRYDLSVRLRLLMQMLIACILVFGAGLYIHEFGNMFGFALDIGVLGTVLTVFAVLGAINAFNMTDGIDGLAGSLALNTFLSLAMLFWLCGEHNYLQLPIILSVALLPYLLFNLGLVPGPVKRIFMGDAGSMFIGLTVIWLLTLGSQGENPAFRTVTALWIIAVPLMDMAAIIVRRLRRGQSPFMADRDHLHHIFMQAGFCPRMSLLIIVFFSVLYSTIGILGEVLNVPEAVMFYGFLAVFALYLWGINHAWRLSKWLSVKRLSCGSN